jgi:hypothetical protein
MPTRKTTPVTRTAAKAPRPNGAKAAVAGAAKKRASKASTATQAAPAASEPAKTKHKLVRDSFTIPKTEYAALAELKQRAAQLARPVKKGELLRAGIKALSALGDKAFLAALDAVPSLKTGRPKEPEAPASKSATQ